MHAEHIARPTATALAFIDAAAKYPGKFRRSVEIACSKNAGLVRERSVQSSLSFKTASKLKKEGAL